MTILYWIQAARLRTLPLAAASTGFGCLSASLQGKTHTGTTALIMATAVSLQIFSNFANDYGDAFHGADSPSRRGPARMVSSGKISSGSMKKTLYLNALICCLLGGLLLLTALPRLARPALPDWLFWLAGILSLLAAYCYTAGRKPYGYIGLGDASVFLFFGIIAVLGSEYLHTGRLNTSSLAPAAAMGFWCSMVLNLNNMRDIDNDTAAGKHTLATRLGLPAARIYHTCLTLAAALCWATWLPVYFTGTALLFLQALIIILSLNHLNNLKKAQSPETIDPLLPRWSTNILLWVAVLWLAA